MKTKQQNQIKYNFSILYTCMDIFTVHIYIYIQMHGNTHTQTNLHTYNKHTHTCIHHTNTYIHSLLKITQKLQNNSLYSTNQEPTSSEIALKKILEIK